MALLNNCKKKMICSFISSANAKLAQGKKKKKNVPIAGAQHC